MHYHGVLLWAWQEGGHGGFWTGKLFHCPLTAAGRLWGPGAALFLETGPVGPPGGPGVGVGPAVG